MLLAGTSSNDVWTAAKSETDLPVADQINTPVEHDHAPTIPLVAVAGVIDFWEQVCVAQHVSLFLDFDGTLAPFQADRLQAFPLPGTVAALDRIIDSDLASVAIVSGRPISEITLLLES